jgi:hypothetical protein
VRAHPNMPNNCTSKYVYGGERSCGQSPICGLGRPRSWARFYSRERRPCGELPGRGDAAAPGAGPGLL